MDNTTKPLWVITKECFSVATALDNLKPLGLRGCYVQTTAVLHTYNGIVRSMDEQFWDGRQRLHVVDGFFFRQEQVARTAARASLQPLCPCTHCLNSPPLEFDLIEGAGGADGDHALHRILMPTDRVDGDGTSH